MYSTDYTCFMDEYLAAESGKSVEKKILIPILSGE